MILQVVVAEVLQLIIMILVVMLLYPYIQVMAVPVVNLAIILEKTIYVLLPVVEAEVVKMV